jgi:hypothetical protein
METKRPQDQKEEWRQRLFDKELPMYDAQGNEIFYLFNEDLPKYSISLTGKLKGPRGISNKKLPERGHARVQLKINGKSKTLYIRDIMSETFMLNEDPTKILVNLDGNKLNNDIRNLCYVSPSSHEAIKNPGKLETLKKFSISDECCKRLIDPNLEVYDSEGKLIFYDYLDDDGKPTGYFCSPTGLILGPSGKILDYDPHPSGYILIHIHNNGSKWHVSAHIMIAKTFLINDDPINKTQVHHRNHTTTDNCVNNLEFVTPSENNLEKSDKSKTNRPIIEIDPEGEIVNRWKTILDCASYFDISKYTIKRYCENGIPLEEGRYIEFETKSEEADLAFKSYARVKRAIPIIQTNENGSFYWPSARDATSQYGNKKSPTSIWSCINGDSDSAHGSTWRKATEKEINFMCSEIPPFSKKYGNWKRLEMDDGGNILVSDEGYVVNNWGEVSFGTLARSGYRTLKYEGKQYYVHRLVIKAFIPEGYSEKYDVDHIDGNKERNNILNLRYLTHKENSTYALGIPVIGYKESGEKIGPFKSINEAGRFLGHENGGNSIRIAVDTDKTSYGYYWRSV